jgi:hypothetical protein
MDTYQMTAPCGIDCFNCPVYLANENESLRNRVAETLGVPAARAICRGCRNQNGTIACLDMTEPCGVYQCIEEKNLHFCHECADFPCDHLHPYADKAGERPHNAKVFNLCLIKKMGLERWAQSKAKEVRSVYFSQKFKL